MAASQASPPEPPTKKTLSSLCSAFDNKISEPLSDEVNSLIRLFNHLITLKSFLNGKNVKNILTFFQFRIFVYFSAYLHFDMVYGCL